MPVTRSADTWTVTTTQEIRYQVSLVSDYFTNGDPSLILGGHSAGRRAVVIDKNVHRLYWPKLSDYFGRHGITAVPIEVAISEATKNPATLLDLCAKIKRVGLRRHTEPIIGIGGGVVTDVVGLAASLLSRGMPWVRVVTTLQQLDAGTSIKTGVNLEGKSDIGAFHAPEHTIIDPTFLKTLAPAHIVDTMAEAIKVAIIMNAPLFRLLEQHGRDLIKEKLQGFTPETASAARTLLTEAITGSLEDNADNIVEKVTKRRMYFGHTWGPWLEFAALGTRWPLLHGEGVAIDMALSAVIALRQGLINQQELDRILGLLRGLGLPVSHPYLADSEGLAKATEQAIRTRDGHLVAPLPNHIGTCKFVEVPIQQLLDSAAWLGGEP